MKSYFDESGAFDWTPAGTSLFAGVTVTDRSVATIFSAFETWKEKIAGATGGEEIKGWDLREIQLDIFVKWVVLPHRDFHVSLYGVDTAATEQGITQRWIEDAVRVCRAASEFENNRGNAEAGRRSHTMANWLAQRSPQNGLWMAALPRAILRTVQQTVVRHVAAEDDVEFEHWDIVIDRSFIHTSRHEDFWRAWLRSTFLQATNQNPITVLDVWLERDHPYLLNARRRGADQIYVNASQDLRAGFRFADSQDELGLQLADICAAIGRRWFTDRWTGPFERLKPRIFFDEGRHYVQLLHLNESSLMGDRPPADAVRMFDLATGEIAAAAPAPSGNGPVT